MVDYKRFTSQIGQGNGSIKKKENKQIFYLWLVLSPYFFWPDLRIR